MHALLLIAASHDRLITALTHCKYTSKDLLFIQVFSDPTSVHCTTAFARVHSSLLIVALQYKLTAALFHYKCSSKKSLCNRLTAGLCVCKYTYEDLLCIQVCSDSTSMHCSTGFGKMHGPLLSAALQNGLTAGLCDCKYTYEDLLCIQVCKDSTMHCSTGFGKMHAPLLSAALQNRLTVGLCHCKHT